MATDADKYSVRWWLDCIERAQSGDYKKYRERAKQVTELYDGEKEKSAKSFNVLWTNVQTMMPSLYSEIPKPNIRNRWLSRRDQLYPIAAGVSTVFERAINYMVDFVNFDRIGVDMTLDYLTAGRGTIRVRYRPYFGEGDPVRYAVEISENGDMTANGEVISDDEVSAGTNGFYVERPGPERKVYEEVVPEHVHWDDLVHDPAKTWDRVRWVAFRHHMTEDELIDNYGRKGRRVSMTHDSDDKEPTAEIWEVWCKITRKVYVVTEGFDEFLLKDDDPLGLQEFYPIPEPAYAVPRSGSLVPKPEYTMYQHLAEEVDELTHRIKSVAATIRGRGAYPKDMGDLLALLEDTDDAELIPVENWSAFMEKGGLSGIIDWLPVKEMADALIALVRERNNAMQTIYEITGISDILRGSTDPRETARAQGLKAQFGTRRLRLKQRDIQRMFRDTYRLMAEIIAEHFDAQTLTMMTGVPITEQHTQLMNSDLLRTFAIDIETDSTIAADEQAEKADVIEFFGAAGQFMAGIGPLIQQQVLPFEAGKAMLMEAARRFRFGRKTEELLESMQAPQPQPSAKEQMEMQDMQRRAEEGKMREQSRAMKTQADVVESQARTRRAEAETAQIMSDTLDEKEAPTTNGGG